MKWAFEYILQGEIIFALYILLVDIIVFIGDAGYAYALCITFLVYDQARQVVLRIAAGIQGKEVQPSLYAGAE